MFDPKATLSWTIVFSFSDDKSDKDSSTMPKVWVETGQIQQQISASRSDITKVGDCDEVC